MAESIELATILLTDLVGSTRLANSVGPARADELRDEHFELLRDAIGSYGGTEFKNTGDGLMAAFSSPSAAVHCAVTMQQLFERRYRYTEQALHVRIGLAAGESTVSEGDYFGSPSIEAARLCAAARGDGIVLSATTRALAGRCEGIEFSSLGGLELKGFPDPVEAFAALWSPLDEESAEAPARWPLPERLRSVPPVRFVGRSQERSALRQRTGLAQAGQRQAIFLSGQPGIGKTRLAGYAAHQANSQGFVVAWGGCSEELAVPYEPWIAACSHLVEHAPAELLQTYAQVHGGELARLAGNLPGRVPGLPEPRASDPETERYLLFSSVAGLLEHVAQTAPVCLVLDDLQWADTQSLALLKHVLHGAEQSSVIVIVTYRDSDLGKDHPLTGLLADAHRLQGVQRIALRGLAAADVAELMSAATGHDLPPHGLELADRITAETDGNPFFVGEILRGLSESGSLAFGAGATGWEVDSTDAIRLPESVREVIERRAERLGGRSQQALRLASVIGREFDLRLLAAAVELDEEPLLDELEVAVSASLLTESSETAGRFRFAHALINQTLYEGIGATRRARMHQRVAEALEELYGEDPGEHLAELALHWRLASVSVNKAKSADYALKAGRHALRQLAPDEAVKYFHDALELGGDEDSRERLQALIGLGRAQRQTGDPAFRGSLLEASRVASTLGDAELAAQAAIANSRGFTSAIGREDKKRLGAIARAIELDEPSDPLRRAQLLAAQAMELNYSADRSQRQGIAQQAIALARGARDLRTLAIVLSRAFYATWSPETLALRCDIAAEFAGHAAALKDPALGFSAQLMLLQSLVESGELSGAREASERAHAIADRLGQPTLCWFAVYHRAALELLHGDLLAGEALAEQAFQLGQSAGQPDAAVIYGGQIYHIRAYQGRGEETVEMLRQSAAALPGVPSISAGLATTLCWADRFDEAREIVARGVGDEFSQLSAANSDVDTLGALVLYADAAVMTADVRAAALLFDRLEPLGEQVAWNSVNGYGHVRQYLGLLAGVLGDAPRATEHLEFALRFHEANGMPIWTARCHLGLAESLASWGDEAGMREHAQQTLAISREHGYGAFASRAETLLDRGSAGGRAGAGRALQ